MLSAIGVASAQVGRTWTTMFSGGLTLMGFIRDFFVTQWLPPQWAWWLAAIALMLATAIRLQLKLDEARAPKRDTPLRHALFFALHGRWPTEDLASTGIMLKDGDFERGNRLLGQMRRHARDGTLKVWGQPYSSSRDYDEDGVLPPIDREYWEGHELDVMCLAGDAPLSRVKTSHSGHVTNAGLGLYCGLMVNRREVEALCPPPMKRVKLQIPWRFAETHQT